MPQAQESVETGLVGVVGVEPPGHGFRRNLERLSPGRPLQGFEVDIRQPAFADQVFHLGGDFGREPGLKRFFLTALACLASSHLGVAQPRVDLDQGLDQLAEPMIFGDLLLGALDRGRRKPTGIGPGR